MYNQFVESQIEEYELKRNIILKSIQHLSDSAAKGKRSKRPKELNGEDSIEEPVTCVVLTSTHAKDAIVRKRKALPAKVEQFSMVHGQ